MAWISLIFGGLFEMVGVMMMNLVQQKRNIRSVLYLAAAFAASFSLLGFAMKTLPMGTCYAVWTGIGATGGAILGMIFYGESKSYKRMFFIFLIICATIGLRLVS